jgi:hypothetical protein
MQRFEHELPEYPLLAFRVLVRLIDRKLPQLSADIRAIGDFRARRKWREDFRDWCAQHEVNPTLTNKLSRPKDSSEYSVWLTNWSQIAEFMVRWIGLEWMESAAFGAEGMKREIGKSVRLMQQQLEELDKRIRDIHVRAQVTDYRVWAAARAILGETVNVKEIIPASYNWGYVREQFPAKNETATSQSEE